MGTGGSGAGGSSAEFDAEMFFVEACSECHGATGDGVDGKGPDIKHPIEDYSEYVIRNGRGPQDDISGNFNLLYEEAMPAFPEVIISAEELAAVFGFLAMQPQPTEGKMLYEDYCAACHGHDAQGGMTTRSLKSVFGSFSTPIRNGEHTNMMTQRREYMPAFPTDMISDAEIQMIQTYVQGL
jgi:cytochrome c oxidase cbb3-type subunit 3